MAVCRSPEKLKEFFAEGLILEESTLYSPSVIQYICFLNPLEKRNCPLAWPSMMCEILRTSNMHLNWLEYRHRACSPVLSSPHQLWSIYHLRHLVCNHNSMHKAYITQYILITNQHQGNFHDFRQHTGLKTKPLRIKNLTQSQSRGSASLFTKVHIFSGIKTDSTFVMQVYFVQRKWSKVKHICQA